MATITYKPRYGKDFIEFNKRQLLDSRLATDWAIEAFALIDNEPINISDICKLTDKAYLMISSKIFCQNDVGIVDENGLITYDEWTIKESEVDKNLITYIQTTDKSDYVNLLIKIICKIYNIDLITIEKMPYNLVSYMMQKITNFLSELAKPRDSFDIEERDLFRDS